MFFGSKHPEDPELDDRRNRGRRTRRVDRSWSTRLAWGVLTAGAALVVMRASVATFVQVHGEGMAPTILDGDRVVMLRTQRLLQAGDVLIYDPQPPPANKDEGHERKMPRPGGEGGHGKKDDPSIDADRRLRNTAVVDMDEIDQRWQGLSEKDQAAEENRSFRVGRVIALPGDRVTFNVPNAALGLMINGEILRQEGLGESKVPPSSDPPSQNRDQKPPDSSSPLHASQAFEWLGPQRYQILRPEQSIGWPGIELLSEEGPMEIRADGYLILADNREDGACCDSRRLGWISREQIRGEVILRYRKSSDEGEGESQSAWVWLP